MTKRISTALGSSKKRFERAGVFDGVIDRDSPLYIDPHLLSLSQHPEMVLAARSLTEYWRKLMLVVSKIWDDGDLLWRKAYELLQFPENHRTGLGYAKSGRAGSAIGKQTAKNLLRTASDLIRAGIEEPEIFEIVGLIEPGIGPDLISDMTTYIIMNHLHDFTERIASEIELNCEMVMIGKKKLPMNPSNNNDYLILLPKDILCELPTAFSWEDVDLVCAYNSELRERVNKTIGDTWKKAVEDNKKEKLKAVLLKTPELLKDLLSQYKNKKPRSYDFVKDTFGETLWVEQAEIFASNNPLDLSSHSNRPIDEIVKSICEHFCKLVDHNGLSKLFWTDEKELRHERFAQLLFFAVADIYCKSSNIDISPECDAGRGPVDFKVSSGYNSRVLVEVKWSTNTRLRHGYQSQLETYAKAESTDLKFFLILQVTDQTKAIDSILELRNTAIKERRKSPEVFIADARIKSSASKNH